MRRSGYELEPFVYNFHTHAHIHRFTYAINMHDSINAEIEIAICSNADTTNVICKIDLGQAKAFEFRPLPAGLIYYDT